MAVLELVDVAKSFTEQTVLAALNLTVTDRELLVLVGPSGCGKSTLLRLIAGLEEPTSGQIRLDGRDLTPLAPKDRDVAMVFQNYALYPHLSVYNNLAFGLKRRADQPWSERLGDWAGHLPGVKYRSKTALDWEAQVRQIAQVLQIEPLLMRFPSELSGGQKQRVALGRAMIRNPKLYLMDEPLSNLDAQLRTQTRTQIVQWQQQLATTTIYVTHDQTEAMTMGTRIAVMNQGYLQQVATPLEIYRQPANTFVAGFIGEPAMNLFPVQAIVREAQGYLVGDGFTLLLPETVPIDRLPPTLTLGIRPEHLTVNPTQGIFQATVNVVETLGRETQVFCEAQAGAMRLRVDAEQTMHPGEQLRLGVQSEFIHLFDAQTGQRLGW